MYLYCMGKYYSNRKWCSFNLRGSKNICEIITFDFFIIFVMETYMEPLLNFKIFGGLNILKVCIFHFKVICTFSRF